MHEPEPMRQVHKIREKIYEETKHMSDKEYIAYIQKNARQAQKERKKLKGPKDLKTFLLQLKKQQAS